MVTELMGFLYLEIIYTYTIRSKYYIFIDILIPSYLCDIVVYWYMWTVHFKENKYLRVVKLWQGSQLKSSKIHFIYLFAM